MKTTVQSPRQLRRISAARRARLLRAFERSGLSAAAFARQYHLNYTTFCGWRSQGRTRSSPGFVQVELPAPGLSAASELVIELGPQARTRVSSGQVGLLVQLLKALNGGAPC